MEGFIHSTLISTTKIEKHQRRGKNITVLLRRIPGKTDDVVCQY